MGFLKRIFGGDEQKGGKDSAKPAGPYVDKQGVYLYVRCDNCGTPVRVRADKQYDLVNEGGSYTWHKTIVDNRCFRQIPAVVTFNLQYEITDAQIIGGRFITQAEYDEWYSAKQAAEERPPTADDGPPSADDGPQTTDDAPQQA